MLCRENQDHIRKQRYRLRRNRLILVEKVGGFVKSSAQTPACLPSPEVSPGEGGLREKFNTNTI